MTTTMVMMVTMQINIAQQQQYAVSPLSHTHSPSAYLSMLIPYCVYASVSAQASASLVPLAVAHEPEDLLAHASLDGHPHAEPSNLSPALGPTVMLLHGLPPQQHAVSRDAEALLDRRLCL